jgi:exodeoxyribonuclease V alpha subunit
MNSYPVKPLYDRGLLTDIDLRFADLMAGLSGDRGGDALYLACALLSNTVVRGKHVCLDFDAWSARPLAALLDDDRDARESAGPLDVLTPPAEEWMRQIARSPVSGAPGDYAPLVLDQPGRRLYLYRYWRYERQLAAGFRDRLVQPPEHIPADLLREALDRCFPASGIAGGVNWQKVAAFAALTRNVCVITGGPGTGKTFTAARIIRLLLEQRPDITIALCAPTGKAAARLQEAMARVRREMAAAGAGPADRFPDTVTTIHRLLGASDGGFGFRYHEHRLLPADVILIDEASMVSLSLMARLFAAADRRTRLVFLGDKNQLASVEAGAVLGDICGAASADGFSDSFRDACRAVCGEQLPQSGPGSRLEDCVVELKTNFRFPEGSCLAAVSHAVNRGDDDETVRIIDRDVSGMVVRQPLPDRQNLEAGLERITRGYFENILGAETVEAALAALDAFRIVCALRQGPYGVEAVNRLVEKMLAVRGLIDISDPFYHGRPIMITRNDYGQRLYNGDVGIIWTDAAGIRQAFFSDPRRCFRSFSPPRLPPHETVYALTIHKAQGSEFDALLMILPEKMSPVLTRELVYTGLTRARKQVTLWAGDDILRAAVAARVSRRSGLRDALAGISLPTPESEATGETG